MWDSRGDSGGPGGGVIGTFGNAWSATDDEAAPFSTNGNLYDETDQADVDALRGTVFQYQTFARGMIRYRDGGGGGGEKDGDWVSQDLTLAMVPEPGSFLLLGVVLVGSAVLAGRRKPHP